MGDHPGVNPGVLLQPGANLLNEADSWDGEKPGCQVPRLGLEGLPCL